MAVEMSQFHWQLAGASAFAHDSIPVPVSGTRDHRLREPPSSALVSLHSLLSGGFRLLAGTVHRILKLRRRLRIPGDATRRLARAVRSPSSDDASERLAALTNREREILKLFAAGLSYQEIGEIRNNSALTVRNGVAGVQKKLGFRTRQQMVVWAVRSGLVDGGSE